MKTGEVFNPYLQFHGLFIPNSIAMSDIIPSNSKLLLGRLMQFAGSDGKAYPTRKKLCKELGFTLSTVNRAIRNLKDLKLIKTFKKDPDSNNSPNIYVFTYCSAYKTPLLKPVKDRGVISDTTPPVTSDTTPLSDPTHNNRVNSIESNSNRIPFSNEKEPPGVGRVEFNGLLCKRCGEKQFETPSGATCKNGHGGEEGVEPKKKILQSLPRIGTPTLKKIESKSTQILNVWRDYCGKVHVDKNAKGSKNIESFINDELLKEGLNTCYSQLTQDAELKQKIWTVKEICDCIIFYAGEDGLNKEIDGMYFDSFVKRRFNGFGGRNAKDHSPLLDSFKNLPTYSRSETAKKLTKIFTTEFPDATVHAKSIITIAGLLDNYNDDYEIKDVRSFVDLFFHFMNRQVEIAGNDNPIRFMASQTNLNDFFNGIKHKIKKRTPAEKKEWLKQERKRKEYESTPAYKAKRLKAQERMKEVQSPEYIKKMREQEERLKTDPEYKEEMRIKRIRKERADFLKGNN